MGCSAKLELFQINDNEFFSIRVPNIANSGEPMSIRHPNGVVKWSIASTGLALRREVRDFDDYVEVVTMVIAFRAMGLENYILRNQADRVEKVFRPKPEGNPFYRSLIEQGEILKD